jgi:predicted metal-dependent hydrolase
MHPLQHKLFIQYIIHFNIEKDYFECHEVGEEYWKSLAPKDKMHPLTGWIQMAVGMYHWRRSNYPGALRSFIRSKAKLSDAGIWMEGFDRAKLIEQISEAIVAVTERKPFQPFLLPLASEELQEKVDAYRQAHPNEEQDPHFVMHKHRLRDRSSIINLREQRKKRNLEL